MPEIMDDIAGIAAAVLPPVDGIDVGEPGEACPAVPQRPAVPTAAELAVARELVASARERGVALIGEGGLWASLTKTVIEAALDEEMTEHLGYSKSDAAGRNSGNSRNGTRAKTVISGNCGPVQIEVPRDRNGTFDPQIVKKHERRLGDVDAIVLSLTARGLTTGEVSAHFAEAYGLFRLGRAGGWSAGRRVGVNEGPVAFETGCSHTTRPKGHGPWARVVPCCWGSKDCASTGSS